MADRAQAEEAFAVFYRRHVTVVLAFYAKRGVDPALAGDLAAETFAAALLARRKFREREGDARPWLLKIAANKLVDHARRSRRDDNARTRLGMERVELSAQDVADYDRLAVLDNEAVTAALDELPAAQRRAVEARVIANESYPEIADRLGVEEAAVRQNVSRGLARMRARLEKIR
ncbi:RNA polymerase sigma factor [Patulibacter defluvii]|uniref:RNA polymerase sigma factor n=1 Tax=Patulibacter defluvii TaxID=3095358 RepID=UPI002A74A2EA|nr:sigma-70 family RNA polymerase sigma factor [Patulibacter sp. DM4]